LRAIEDAVAVAMKLRKHYFLEEWVVVAPERRLRPHPKVGEEGAGGNGCFFCPGNEETTPPATLVLKEVDGKIVKLAEEGDHREKNWLIRCFPNKYPILSPREGMDVHGEQPLLERGAKGFHEVMVVTPDHEATPLTISLEQWKLILEACLDRCRWYAEHEFVKHISVIENRGRLAGASIEHPHLQLFALSMVPPRILKELPAFKQGCPLCELLPLEEERKERVVYSSPRFLAICPWASRYPYEVWIIPRKHSSAFMDLRKKEIEELAYMLKTVLSALELAVPEISYNYSYILGPLGDESYHWKVEIYPRLTTPAGFEFSTDIMVNPIPPEEAASKLRKKLEELKATQRL